jgi:HK97 family phage major capsid protein
MRALIASPDWNAQVEQHGLAKDCIRWVTCLAATGGDAMEAKAMLGARWPKSKAVDLFAKAAIDAGSTTGDMGALSPVQAMAAAYLQLLRPKTILGQLQGLRIVPTNISFPRQTAGASVGWTAEGSPIQASPLAFDTVTLPPTKLAGLVVVSKELARSSDPAAERLIEQDLTRAIAAFMDAQFLDPSVTAIADLTPASVTNGGPSVAASGDTADAFKADVRALIAEMAAAGCVFAAPAWIMSPLMAISLATMGLDPAMNLTGGSLFGVPVLTSTAAPTTGDSPDNQIIALIDAAGIAVADAGLVITASGEGDVQMSDSPDSPPTEATVTVSLWQRNLVGILATRSINYARVSPGSAGYITSANYGAA